MQSAYQSGVLTLSDITLPLLCCETLPVNGRLEMVMFSCFIVLVVNMFVYLSAGHRFNIALAAEQHHQYYRKHHARSKV